MRALRTEAPAFAPVTLASFKAHLRIEYDDDDTVLTDVLAAALAYIDGPNGIGFTLASQRWDFFASLAEFANAQPFGYSGGYGMLNVSPARELRLPVWPLISVQSLAWLDDAGTWNTLDAGLYRLANAGYPPIIARTNQSGWPVLSPGPDRFRIAATIGHATLAEIPADILAAVRMLAAHWFRNPEAYQDRTLFEVPLGVEAILAKYRVNLVGG